MKRFRWTREMYSNKGVDQSLTAVLSDVTRVQELELLSNNLPRRLCKYVIGPLVE